MEQIKQTVSALMITEELPTCTSDQSIAEALTVIRGRHMGCVLIVSDNRVEGIFTERDLLRYMATHDDDLESVPVRSLMTRNPETLQPSDCVSYAINMMVIGGYRNIPIIDNAKELVGLITVRDVTNHLTVLLGSRESGDVDGSVDSEWQDFGGG